MNHQLVLLCAAALLSTTALAEDAKPKSGVEAKFEALDKDADGRLSREEMAVDAGLAGSFGTIDNNADGYVSLDEFRAKVRMKGS